MSWTAYKNQAILSFYASIFCLVIFFLLRIGIRFLGDFNMTTPYVELIVSFLFAFISGNMLISYFIYHGSKKSTVDWKFIFSRQGFSLLTLVFVVCIVSLLFIAFWVDKVFYFSKLVYITNMEIFTNGLLLGGSFWVEFTLITYPLEETKETYKNKYLNRENQILEELMKLGLKNYKNQYFEGYYEEYYYRIHRANRSRDINIDLYLKIDQDYNLKQLKTNIGWKNIFFREKGQRIRIFYIVNDKNLTADLIQKELEKVTGMIGKAQIV